jgi:hypothetical protein
MALPYNGTHATVAQGHALRKPAQIHYGYRTAMR